MVLSNLLICLFLNPLHAQSAPPKAPPSAAKSVGTKPAVKATPKAVLPKTATVAKSKPAKPRSPASVKPKSPKSRGPASTPAASATPAGAAPAPAKPEAAATATAATPAAPVPTPAAPVAPVAAPVSMSALDRSSEGSFVDTFPALKDYLAVEPPSGFHLGFGLSPLGILKDRTYFSADIFQLHWINKLLDVQVLNATFGITRAQTSAYQSNNFTFTSSVNVRIGQIFSVGPLLGYEFVSFTNLNAQLFKSPFITPEEPFSSQGYIYGVNVSETFPWRGYLIQLSEVGYQETYSNEKTPQNWRYIFTDKGVRNQPSLIAPRVVALVKLSFLF